MSQSVKPSYDKSLAAKPDETGEQYLTRLAHRRAAKQFPEFDPEDVIAANKRQLEDARAKGRRGPQATL